MYSDFDWTSLIKKLIMKYYFKIKKMKVIFKSITNNIYNIFAIKI